MLSLRKLTRSPSPVSYPHTHKTHTQKKGMAEVSARGDVNVSSFPGRSPGCGGFIDISQSARKVVFVGTFTSGGLHVRVDSDGGGGAGRRNGSGGSSGGSGNGSGEKRSLSISSEGRHPKFKASVGEVTFAGSSAGGREVVYVTERALFRLREVVERGGGTRGGRRASERRRRRRRRRREQKEEENKDDRRAVRGGPGDRRREGRAEQDGVQACDPGRGGAGHGPEGARRGLNFDRKKLFFFDGR